VTTVPPYYQLRKHSAGPILEARYQKLRRLPPADSDDYQKWVALINFQASQMSHQTACCRWFWFRCYWKAYCDLCRDEVKREQAVLRAQAYRQRQRLSG